MLSLFSSCYASSIVATRSKQSRLLGHESCGLTPKRHSTAAERVTANQETRTKTEATEGNHGVIATMNLTRVANGGDEASIDFVPTDLGSTN